MDGVSSEIDCSDWPQPKGISLLIRELDGPSPFNFMGVKGWRSPSVRAGVVCLWGVPANRFVKGLVLVELFQV